MHTHEQFRVLQWITTIYLDPKNRLNSNYFIPGVAVRNHQADAVGGVGVAASGACLSAIVDASAAADGGVESACGARARETVRLATMRRA